MTSRPFIEVPILENADEIDLFIAENALTCNDIELRMVTDDEFGGWFGEFVLIDDGEVLANTVTFDNINKLQRLLKDTLGRDYTIEIDQR